MAEVLVVASKVKEMVRKKSCNTSGDFPAALSKKVERMVTEAIDRAKANGRKTVQAKDA